jgi:hypothetical protein
MSGTDATVLVAGPLLDIVDDEWRADTLPEDGAPKLKTSKCPIPVRPPSPSPRSPRPRYSPAPVPLLPLHLTGYAHSHSPPIAHCCVVYSTTSRTSSCVLPHRPVWHGSATQHLAPRLLPSPNWPLHNRPAPPRPEYVFDTYQCICTHSPHPPPPRAPRYRFSST